MLECLVFAVLIVTLLYIYYRQQQPPTPSHSNPVKRLKTTTSPL